MNAKGLPSKKSEEPVQIAHTIDEPAPTQDKGRRIIPILTGIYLWAIINSPQINFTNLPIVDDSQPSAVESSLGYSLFFSGSVVVEFLCVLAACRFGARLWFTRIAITWGALTVLLACSSSVSTFYPLQFLLGAAEGGVCPAVIFYLALRFTKRNRVRASGLLTLERRLREHGVRACARSIAGHVENVPLFALMRTLGCDAVRGRLIGRTGLPGTCAPMAPARAA